MRTDCLFSISSAAVDVGTVENGSQHAVIAQTIRKKGVDRTSRDCAFSAAPGFTATLEYAFGALSFRDDGGAT